MIQEIINLFRPRWYVCEPLDWVDTAGPAARIKVRAWGPNSARMKAYDLLQCENIIVREYE